MASDPAIGVTSRRAILGAALGGAAALGVQALASAPGVRAAPTAVLTETANTATANTGLAADLASGTVLDVTNSTADPSKTSAGLHGHAANGLGLQGTSDTNVGVQGTTADATNAATDTEYTGVYGFVDGTGLDPNLFVAVGVWGDTSTGIGLLGTGPNGVVGNGGWGVYGYSEVADGIGVFADSLAPAFALRVNGKAHFSRSGRVLVGKTKTSVRVSMAGVTSASMILATIQANKIGLYVRGVVAATNKFTIYLSKAPGATIRIAYLVLD
jgi:hypothetical protein